MGKGKSKDEFLGREKRREKGRCDGKRYCPKGDEVYGTAVEGEAHMSTEKLRSLLNR